MECVCSWLKCRGKSTLTNRSVLVQEIQLFKVIWAVIRLFNWMAGEGAGDPTDGKPKDVHKWRNIDGRSAITRVIKRIMGHKMYKRFNEECRATLTQKSFVSHGQEEREREGERRTIKRAFVSLSWGWDWEACLIHPKQRNQRQKKKKKRAAVGLWCQPVNWIGGTLSVDDTL